MSQKLGGIGEETKFDFHYIPNLGQMTEMGHAEKLLLSTRNTSRRPAWVFLVLGALAVVGMVIAKFLDKLGQLQTVLHCIASKIMI